MTSTTTVPPGLHWAVGGYRCPSCTRDLRAVMFDTVEAFVCHDCATYWLTPTSDKADTAAGWAG